MCRFVLFNIILSQICNFRRITGAVYLKCLLTADENIGREFKNRAPVWVPGSRAVLSRLFLQASWTVFKRGVRALDNPTKL